MSSCKADVYLFPKDNKSFMLVRVSIGKLPVHWARYDNDNVAVPFLNNGSNEKFPASDGGVGVRTINNYHPLLANVTNDRGSVPLEYDTAACSNALHESTSIVREL